MVDNQGWAGSMGGMSEDTYLKEKTAQATSAVYDKMFFRHLQEGDDPGTAGEKADGEILEWDPMCGLFDLVDPAGFPEDEVF